MNLKQEIDVKKKLVLYAILEITLLISGCFHSDDSTQNKQSNNQQNNNQLTSQSSNITQSLPDIDGSTYYTTHNNSERLVGDLIGNGEDSLTSLQKQINVTFLTSNENYEIGTSISTRSSSTSNFSRHIIPIKNISTELRCIIEFSGIDYLDSENNIFKSDDLGFTFVEGSTYTSDLIAANFDSCLAPNETGYVLDIDNVYDRLNTIQIGEILDSTQSFSLPAGKAIPTDYTISSDGSLLTVNIENQGTEVISLSFIPHFILLDQNGVSLYWGLFDFASNINIEPQSSISVSIESAVSSVPLYPSVTNIIRPIAHFTNGAIGSNISFHPVGDDVEKNNLTKDEYLKSKLYEKNNYQKYLKGLHY